jgi:hypothetical protein
MSQDRWNAYVAYHLACVRARIHETERLMRPPTPEELLCLQKAMQRLREQEAYLAAMHGVETLLGVCEPALNGDAPSCPAHQVLPDNRLPLSALPSRTMAQRLARVAGASLHVRWRNRLLGITFVLLNIWNPSDWGRCVHPSEEQRP